MAFTCIVQVEWLLLLMLQVLSHFPSGGTELPQRVLSVLVDSRSPQLLSWVIRERECPFSVHANLVK